MKNLTLKHKLYFDKKFFYTDKKFLHTDKIFSYFNKSQDDETLELVQVHVESQSEVEDVEVAVEHEDRSHNPLKTDQENPLERKIVSFKKNKVSSSKPLSYDEDKIQKFSDDDFTLETAQHCLVTWDNFLNFFISLYFQNSFIFNSFLVLNNASLSINCGCETLP